MLIGGLIGMLPSAYLGAAEESTWFMVVFPPPGIFTLFAALFGGVFGLIGGLIGGELAKKRWGAIAGGVLGAIAAFFLVYDFIN